MIYGFDTEDENAAVGALLVYATYRSRDISKFKGSASDYWGQIERFIKRSAKPSRRLGEFLERLKKDLSCASVKPRWMEIGHQHNPVMIIRREEDGRIKELIEPSTDQRREFLTHIFETADHRSALKLLYSETGWITALVRDRLEREKPIESALTAADVDETPQDPDLLMIQGKAL